MKRIFTLLILSIISSGVYAQFPTIWASKISGDWANTAGDVWETFTGNVTGTPGALGTGTATAAAAVPSGTHLVYIRSGHTIVTTAERSCHSLTVESGGKLWTNQSADIRLRLLVGGTGFTYPQTGIVTNNGTIGDANDGLFLEVPGTNAQNLTIGGSGSYIVRRIRIDGNASTLNVTVDANITFTISASNYALTMAYSPGASGGDNHTFTLNAGKTITIQNGSFHGLNDVVPSDGTYTYNINGTIDLSTATRLTSILPSTVAGKSTTVNINSGGTLKLGPSFNSIPATTYAGTVNLNVANGGTIDATATTTLTTGVFYFNLSPTAVFKRTVAASDVVFPIGTSASNYNPVTLNNSGTSDAFTINVSNTVANIGAMQDATKIVTKQWTITEGVAGGSNATVKLGWVLADQAGGFNPLNPVVIGRWNGTAWNYYPATRSGSGTVSDPYVATATGVTANFSSSNPFVVANTAALPVTFSDAKAFAKDKGIQVEWSVSTESNVANYVVERSVNAREFSTIATVSSKGNSNTLVNYSWFDATPNAGISYYRIKAIDKDGSVRYTGILKVNISKDKAEINVAPNPVKGGQLNVQLSSLTKGTYSLKLYNQMGQVVFTSQVSTEGGSLSQSFTLPSSVRAGTYSLQVSNGDIKLNKRVIVE